MNARKPAYCNSKYAWIACVIKLTANGIYGRMCEVDQCALGSTVARSGRLEQLGLIGRSE